MGISAKLPKPPLPLPTSCSVISGSTLPKPSLLSFSYQFNNSPTKLPSLTTRVKHHRLTNLGALTASSGSADDLQTPSTSTDDAAERWLLQPVGDGDTRHIGFKVAMPDAFEIASDVVTVGRLPEKADMVIPVATVSGVHARIQKREGRLFVTDLDSTNGTFINEKRLRPGAIAPAPPGSLITFGDTHLAIFRVSKLEKVEVPEKSEETEVSEEPVSVEPSNISDITS